MPDTFHNYISGAWVPASSGALHENANPADVRELVSIHSRSARAAALLCDRAEDIGRDFTREQGREALEFLTQLKTVYLDV